MKKRLDVLNSCFSSRKASSALYSKLNILSINSKKAQVTIFIILGILLILLIGIIIAIRSETFTFTPDEAAITEKGQVENFIQSCISSIGGEAVNLVGIQGGYVAVPARYQQDKLHLQISPDFSVPLWAYGNQTYIPELSSIKEQIDTHIERNLRDCLFALEPFQASYNIIEKSDIDADTKILDRKIIFDVYWDLEVQEKSGEVISQLTNHAAQSSVRLKKTYETARAIMEKEMNDLKLEDITQDLIALEHPKVPVAGIELSCRKKQWDVNEARRTLQDMIRYNLKQLQIRGTEVLDYPEGFPYYESHYLWKIDDDFRSKDISVIFNYENNYPFEFQVYPTKNGKLQSGAVGGQDLLKFLCVQSWKFVYDVSYPVMVRVRDDTTGYNFNFAFSVHLVNNYPNRNRVIPERPTIGFDYITDEEFCLRNRVPIHVRTWELVNNGRFASSPEPLSEVNVTYVCLKHGCELGETEFDFEATGYQAGGVFDMPYCVGAVALGKKEGYKEMWTSFNTLEGTTIDLNLAPLVTVPFANLRVVKHSFDELEDVDLESGILTGRELADDEFVSLTLTFQGNQDTPDGRPFHEQKLVLSPDMYAQQDSFPGLELLDKADFTYELEILAFSDEHFIGGFKGDWTPPYDQLEGAEVTFHIAAERSLPEQDMYDLMLNLEQYTENVPIPEIR